MNYLYMVWTDPYYPVMSHWYYQQNSVNRATVDNNWDQFKNLIWDSPFGSNNPPSQVPKPTLPTDPRSPHGRLSPPNQLGRLQTRRLWSYDWRCFQISGGKGTKVVSEAIPKIRQCWSNHCHREAIWTILWVLISDVGSKRLMVNHHWWCRKLSSII